MAAPFHNLSAGFYYIRFFYFLQLRNQVKKDAAGSVLESNVFGILFLYYAFILCL